MRTGELREEIEIELEGMAEMVAESLRLRDDIADGTPTVRDKTAAGAFLAHFYNGIENILKRICKFYAIAPPAGANWHVELFRRFCEPHNPPLPVLFDDDLVGKLGAFRNFRHLFFHTYGFQLDWQRMRIGTEQIEDIFQNFRRAVLLFLEALDQDQD